jgi:deoxycytidylate deaminase
MLRYPRRTKRHHPGGEAWHLHRWGTLYCTHQPCSVCAKMIINAGIRRIIYEEGYPDPFSLEIFQEAGVKLEQYMKEA